MKVPAVTHGFTTTTHLPNGDLFLMSKPFEMAVSDAPEGARVFPVNVENYGGDAEYIGALSGTEPQGLALSARNTTVRAVSCVESIWDGNLMISSTMGTEGDTVRLALESLDGTAGPELALFTVRGAGVEVTELHPHLMAFLNNRFAMGPSTHKGDFVPFSVSAGQNGSRTDLITLAWPMGFHSPLTGCFRVVAEISRGNTEGTTSVVFTDIVVNRNRAPGDENNPGIGLLDRLRGGYPTGFPCKAECPFPTDQIPDPQLPNPPDPGNGEECTAICYRSPQYFRLNIDSLPRGVVLVAGMNNNRPMSTTDKRGMLIALRGGWTPQQQFNAEFTAAQLNMLNAGGDGSPTVFYALNSRLRCYGLDFEPVTLSNGVTLSPESHLRELYQVSRQCVALNMTEDLPALTRIFDLLNGNNPLNSCHNAW
ncbi:MAG: hypothetical protein SF339_03145 [Blastocatellia bacterium]|nr:hypothetical protein [Blastocatellia bacterium]